MADETAFGGKDAECRAVTAPPGGGPRSYYVTEEHATFSFRALVDPANQRLKTTRYRPHQVLPLWQRLLEVARRENLGKLVLYAHPDDWQRFLSHGFILEAVIDGYFGVDPAYCMSYFLDADRQATAQFEEEQQLLEQVLLAEPEAAPPLPAGYRLVLCGEEMSGELAAVFDQVFVTFPTPLDNPVFIRDLIRSGEGIFRAICDEAGQVASAAAAEFEEAAAEITNCATLPEHRGEGLMRVLIDALEEDCRQRGVRTLFSVARARSFGMNLVLRRAAYRYRGRMINQSHICGGFEDMNIWVKGVAGRASPPG